MRLIELSERMQTIRGGDSQSLWSKHMLGSQQDGLGSRVGRIEAIEGSGTTGTNGKGGLGDMKKHPTLSQIKQVLFNRFGGGDAQRARSPYILLRRD